MEALLPSLSPSTETFFRVAYGILLLLTQCLALGQGRRFFMSERWGGYARSGADVDAVQNPRVYPIVMGLWVTSALLITTGVWAVWAALVNVVICHYFFVHMRWKGVLRGMGAPGFMTYWVGVAVLLLEFSGHYARGLQPLAVLVLQADFALIFFSAGLYKLVAGYRRHHGMELGMVNPMWGYWPSVYRRLPTDHWLFRTLNLLAWSSELAAAVLMLIPPTRFWGSLLIIGGFALVATQIRLGTLCYLVMLSGVLFFGPGTPGADVIGYATAGLAASTAPPLAWPAPVVLGLGGILLGYLLLLPLAHAGLFVNFYGRKALWPPLQRALEGYTNVFGIIVWRVFSADLIDFVIRIYRQPRSGTGARTLISRYGWSGTRRFRHVGESITLACLFTTLRYYAQRPEIFRERLLRYARTLPCPPDSDLVFAYVAIDADGSRFQFNAVEEWIVDPIGGDIEERSLSDRVDVRAPHVGSPIHEGARAGSYAPAAPRPAAIERPVARG